MKIEQAQPYKKAVIALLAAEKLPVADLPEILTDFIVAVADTVVVGVAGIEIYGDYGLLRSLAVNPGCRKTGIAGKLLEHIELTGHSKGLKTLYLLTETALEYFTRKGFTQTEREQVPAEVKASSEFSHVCPVSAIVMLKNLNL